MLTHTKRLSTFNPTKFSRSHTINLDKPRVLITGGAGQIGIELFTELSKRYGYGNVILSDVAQLSRKSFALLAQSADAELKDFNGLPFRFVDVTSEESISRVVVEKTITHIIHLASVLSAKGEMNTKFAIALNMRGIENVLEVARHNKLAVYAPSSIAAFGPNIDLDHVKDDVILKPQTIYGVSKVYLEMLGEYYAHKYNLDFRSLRYPGVISHKTPPGGGTTDYAVDIFYKAKSPACYFDCFLKKDARLPMMFMDDCVNGTIQFMEAPSAQLKRRTYNLAAVSFSPEELTAEINKQLKAQGKQQLTVKYDEADFRNKIAAGWPKVLDDSEARKDWGWKHQFGLPEIVKEMLEHVKVE